MLEDAGWTGIANIKETRLEKLALPSPRTEIDVVAGVQGTRTSGFSRSRTLPMCSRWRIFAGAGSLLDDKKPSYATQLSRKFADLAPHTDSVVSALALPAADPAAPCQVRAMLVTREPTPAQFVGGPFRFVPSRTLIEILEDPPEESQPSAGHSASDSRLARTRFDQVSDVVQRLRKVYRHVSECFQRRHPVDA